MVGPQNIERVKRKKKKEQIMVGIDDGIFCATASSCYGSW